MDALLDQPTIADLRAALIAADYHVDAVLDLVTEAGQSGLTRNSTVPARRELGDDATPLATLVNLFVLQQQVPRALVEAAFGAELCGRLVAAGILGEGKGESRADSQDTPQTTDADTLRALIDIRPFGSEDDDASGWVVSDLTPGLDQSVAPMRPDYVLGLSPASTTLAQLVIPAPVGSALDLGTGCGIQSLHLARRAQRVVATDLNPRALQHAQLTFALNEVDVDLRLGSLYEPVGDERFDLIVTNPPYVMSPPTGERLVYREGTFTGDGLVEAVVRGAADHLNPGGTLQVLGNWANLRGVPTERRLAEWLEGSGCDLWVIERERLDVYEYIEMWLTDAGLAASPEWLPRYHQWLDYFDQLGVESVSMGWITVTAAGRDEPEVRHESWPWSVQQPVGAALGRHAADLTASRLPDADFFSARWTLTDTTEETLGQPGQDGYEHIVLRQDKGLRRAIEADTALAAVLGACDGDLPLGVIVDAVAQLLEVDAASLRAEVAPKLRAAVADGFLDRA